MDLLSLLAEIPANDRFRSTVAEYFDMEQHPYGWLSLVPPLVAILLAILTRRILISLFLAVLSGALILTYYDGQAVAEPSQAAFGFIPGEVVDGWNMLCGGVADAWNDHLWPSLIHPDKISVFVFTCLMGAIVGMVNRAAGMRGLLQLLAPLTGSVRKAQIVAWFSGMLVFFDDYANTLLLGTTFRSMFDRLKISREKLAYIVDSTAAPVAGLAIVSTWIAGELSYIQDGVNSGIADAADVNAFDLFLQSIPYRFYVLWALFFVVLLAITRRDFGPMLKAEVRARRGNENSSGSEDEHAEFLLPEDLDWQRMELGEDRVDSETREALAVAHDPTLAPMGTTARSLNAIVPIFVTVVAILAFMFQSGYSSVGPMPTAAAAATEEAAAQGSQIWNVTVWLRDVFGDSNSYTSLVYGSLVGFFFTTLWLGFQRIVPTTALSQAAGTGAAHMVPALLVLWLASTLATMTSVSPTEAYNAELAEAKAMARAVAGVGKTPGFDEMDLAAQVHETLHLHKFNRAVIIETMAPAFSDAERFSHEVTERVTTLSPEGSFYNRYLFQSGRQVDWDQVVTPTQLPTFNPKDEAQDVENEDRPKIPDYDAPPLPTTVSTASAGEPARGPGGGFGGGGLGGGRGAGGFGGFGGGRAAGGGAGGPGPGPAQGAGGRPTGDRAGGDGPGNSPDETAGSQTGGGAPAGGSRPSGGMGQQVRPTEPDFENVWEPDGNLSFPFSDFRHRLHTGQYLSSLLTRQAGDISIADHPLIPWLPTIIFVLAGITAFATGSSWGTMGIVMPLAIPLASSLLSGQGPMDTNDPIFLATIGSVLAGAVFGDHCSPISDTTVLSSQASGCDHLAHVWTQLPYALSVGLVTILFGTIPVGFGIPWQVCLVVGTVALVVIAVFMGRTVESVLNAEVESTQANRPADSGDLE